MEKQRLRDAILCFSQEVFSSCDSLEQALDINERVNKFAEDNNCEALVEDIFIETGAGETIDDLITIFRDGDICEEPSH